MKKEKDIYKDFAQYLPVLFGGRDNITGVTACMTRLRVDIKDKALVKLAALKAMGDVVKGLVTDDACIQIILGPGAASKIEEMFNQMHPAPPPAAERPNAAALKAEINKRNDTSFKRALKSLANIFIPLIPAFIGCGLIMAVNNILLKYSPAWAGSSYAQVLAVFGGAVFFGLSIFVGINAAKEFGGSPMIGGVMAVILTNPALANIELFGRKLVPGRGGVIAVILVVLFSSWLEKRIRKIMPNMLDLFCTPFLVIFISGALALVALQPLGGALADSIVKGVSFALAKGGFLSGFALAFGFLPLVMTGLHQGLAPIHAQLIEVYGYTALFPVLAMAGAGQVGAAFYVLLKTKNAKLKKTIISALPVGMLGVGEPLIYGVTLPLGRPFLAACIGGGFGGALIAHFKVGAYIMGGLSGLPLAPLTTLPLLYLAGILTGYIFGFFAAMLIGFDDPAEGAF